MGLFDAPCGRPPLPPSKDKKVQEKREKARVPPAERKPVCGRKQLPPSADPKVEARRQKARENALKKREAVKQDKAGDMINQNIRAKIAKKRMAKAKEDANPPAPAPPPAPANPFSGLSSLNKNRINKGKQPRKGIVLKPRPAPPAPAPAPAPAPSSSSIKLAPPSPSSSKPMASQLPFSNSPVITQFIQNKVTLDKYSLQNRIDTYKSIVESLNELKDDDCLEKDNTTKGFKIKDIVKLETKIGTKSVYGAIYLTSLMNKSGEYPIASKVMEDSESNLRETHLMNQATISILANKTRHFPINYKVSLCIDNKINKKKRLVNYNELFTGDLKTLVEDRSVLADEELMYNLYFQSQLAIASFQGLLQNVHQDCHWGNFLYHTNNESGYYHYKMEGAGVGGIDLDFYLKSCPYNLVIYDYGLARPISLIKKEVSRKVHFDYDRISSAFNSKNSGWGLYKDLPSKRFDDLVNKLRSDIFNYWYQNMKTPQFDKLFASEMVRIFIKYAPAGLILENAPTNIINKTPFRFTN